MPPAGGPAAPARSMLPPALNAKPMTARAAPHPAPLVFPVLGALLVVAWSSGFVGIRYASDEAPIATILLWRSLVSGLVLLPFALWLGPRIPARALAEQALFAFLGMVLYLGGFALAIGWRVPTGLVALMADLVPLAIAALSWPVLGQRVGPRQWLGMAIGTLGVLAVSADALRLGDAPPLAYALPILGMLAFAVSTVLQRRMRVTELPIHQALCLQCLFAAALFALPAAATGALVPPMTAPFAIGIAWLVGLATLAAWGLYYLALRMYPAARVGAVIYLSPPVTLIWAWALFGEPLSPSLMLGLGVTLAGVWLAAAPARS